MLTVMSAALAATSLAAASPQGPIDAVLADTENFSGVVLASEAGVVVAQSAVGLADDASGAVMTPALDWRWASVTKQVVAVLTMQLVEAGVLSLDTPLNEAAPTFDVRGADQVTVRDLLRHTTGLPDPDDIQPAQFNPSTFDPVSFCTNGRARRGARFNYNNCDFVALAAVIEAAGGGPWQAQLRARILEPAGMANTRVGGATDAGDVTGYEKTGETSGPAYLELFGAAGAIVGPPEDLVRFNTALMDGVLLGETALETLWDGDPSLGFVALGAWSFSAPLSGCEGAVDLVERRGFIAGVQVRNIIAPSRDQSLVVFLNRGDFEFGEIWMGAGFSHAMASAAFCSGERDAP
jgi:D-alanyl-D-alanine carboxypeptidase